MFYQMPMMAFATAPQTRSQAAETPASHMQRTMSLDRSITSFFERQTGQELSLGSLTQFMDDSLLRGQLSYSEHQEYHPLIDELVFYVTQWHEMAESKTASNREAQILLTFGLAFEVDDPKYWRITKQLCENSLQEVQLDTLALMETISCMKEAGILTDKAMRQVSQLVNSTDDLSPNQLIDFTLMFSSVEMHNAVDVSADTSKLEKALISKQQDMDAEGFATVCSVVGFDNAQPNNPHSFNLKLPIFLHANLDRVVQWLEEGAFTDMQDVTFVAAAYVSMYDDGELPDRLLELLESTIQQNALQIEVTQAIHLAQIFSTSGSTFTMEVFDRIIGANIDDITIGEVFDAFMAFSSTEKADVRPKIVQLLLRTLADNLDQLMPSQLISICEVILTSNKVTGTQII